MKLSMLANFLLLFSELLLQHRDFFKAGFLHERLFILNIAQNSAFVWLGAIILIARLLLTTAFLAA